VQRFVTELPEHVNELVGDPAAAEKIRTAPDRVATARALYEGSLRLAARHVRFFQMRDTNDRPIYDLFFATNSDKGHEKMKEAMWKVDASGSFKFSDGLDPDQTVLFSTDPGLGVAGRLWNEFRGRTVDARDLYAYAEKTAYLRKHVHAALDLLENGSCPGLGRIEVESLKHDGSRRRPKTFPEGTIVHFAG
jgi:hypothetical protein